METMKAVRLHQYGGPEVLVLEEVPVPEIAPDDILVQVHAAAINPIDWKIRAGQLQSMLPYQLPFILGRDFSGVVKRVGSDVKNFNIGDEVYGNPDVNRDGSYAQFIAVRASEAAPKPRSIGHYGAASVPLVGLTAWAALFDAGQLTKGQRVLIHAAAGGVGTMAIQLAKWKGAYVIGTASEKNADFLKDLGANEIIDYQTTPFEDVVKDVDVVFDTMGGEVQAKSWSVLKPGGILVSITEPPKEDVAKTHDVRSAFVFTKPDASRLTEIGRLIDAGRIDTVIAKILPLSDAAKAHELSETHHTRGKLILEIPLGMLDR